MGFLRLGPLVFELNITLVRYATDDWYSGLDLGKYVGVIFVDLKKAFDAVDHEILIQKLAHYGTLSHELSWFKSYLSKRYQFTRVNGVDSKIQNLDVGVLQSSCLGPLLFLLQINDLLSLFLMKGLNCEFA